ncbi:V-type ATPase subunit [Sporanaerobacter acetigenes]|uniref:V/A-type H+-transporting ATPase subunit C n=1 Tax=Sporanaerobacter acetigenes DSM 13106 TaxID=1123281 RepID=A0A1M5VV28_9FIRM|nr:V-type ATPase subunit [Sporanaerobacter acetigenes]SHH79040.1 V/A-type H+-transporting ATPase subunit C [Sporanaerobacter acetigenes DSM 13106]
MGNERRFAAINTKIRALSRNLLTDEDFINLFRCKSIEEIASYLKEHTNYKMILEDVNIKNIHRRELEQLIKKYMIFQYEKLFHYFTGEYKRLFKVIFMRYDIEDLKIYLRVISRGEDIENIVDHTAYPVKHGTLDYKKLSNSKNIEEFVENLNDTPYYQILKPYLNEENRRLLFYMEMNLDRLYFEIIKKQGLKLDEEDLKLFQDFLGKNIDLLNLEWIYRGIKYYQLVPEELINYTIEGGHEYNYSDIKEYCYSEEDEFVEKVLNSKYNFLFDTEQDVDLFMERRIERYIYFQFIELYRKGKMNITVSMAYIHLLEYEIRDLYSTIEAIRYGLNLDEGKKYLVRKIEGSDI